MFKLAIKKWEVPSPTHFLDVKIWLENFLLFVMYVYVVCMSNTTLLVFEILPTNCCNTKLGITLLLKVFKSILRLGQLVLVCQTFFLQPNFCFSVDTGSFLRQSKLSNFNLIVTWESFIALFQTCEEIGGSKPESLLLLLLALLLLLLLPLLVAPLVGHFMLLEFSTWSASPWSSPRLSHGSQRLGWRSGWSRPPRPMGTPGTFPAPPEACLDRVAINSGWN